jgi:hypothetical protein
LVDGVIVLGAEPAIAGARGDGIDDRQAKRQPEFFLQRSGGLSAHGDQQRHAIRLQQHRYVLEPAERSARQAAALLLDQRL